MQFNLQGPLFTIGSVASSGSGNGFSASCALSAGQQVPWTMASPAVPYRIYRLPSSTGTAPSRARPSRCTAGQFGCRPGRVGIDGVGTPFDPLSPPATDPNYGRDVEFCLARTAASMVRITSVGRRLVHVRYAADLSAGRQAGTRRRNPHRHRPGHLVQLARPDQRVGRHQSADRPGHHRRGCGSARLAKRLVCHRKLRARADKNVYVCTTAGNTTQPPGSGWSPVSAITAARALARDLQSMGGK